MSRPLWFIALIAVLAGCAPDPQPVADEGIAGTTPAPLDHPVEDIPPATAPAAIAEAMAEAEGQANFNGFGDVVFGTAEGDMQVAWGGELKVEGKQWNDQCFYMTPAWVTAPNDLAFMMGDGVFVRYDTQSERMLAPGGGKVGMSRAQIAALYPVIEEKPHAYIEGLYLVIRDADSGNLLVFETEGTGDEAKATEWRVGVEPHVEFVEGCA